MSASLDGYDLDVDGSAAWTFTTGTRPFKAAFKMQRAAAEEVWAKGFVTLKLDSPGHATVTVEKLTVLSIQPSKIDEQRIVYVSDIRYTWAREWVYRTYNLRKRTGDTRLLKQEGLPAQITPIAQDVGYASWSLFPPSAPAQPWSATGVLIDVVMKATGQVPIVKGGFSRTLPVESLVIDDAGPDAIDRALSFVPGAQITVNAKGRVVLYDENSDDGGDEDIVNVGPPIWGPTLARTVSLRKSRPSKIRVLFQRELEVRFDARSETSDVADKNARELENVGPIPDETLVINGKTKARGTWDLMNSIFDAWALLTDWPGGRPPLGHAEIQRRWNTPRFLDTYSRAPGSKTVLPAPSARVTMALQYYRQCYRIQRFWMERIRSFRLSRVGLTDEETGEHGKSLVYSDFAAIPSVLGVMEHAYDPDALVWNVDGYATLLAGCRASPAELSVALRDQGIFRVAYRADLHGYQADILPSKVVGPDGTENSIPSSDPRKKGSNGSGLFLQYASLSPNHRLAFVITCTPAAPNDERQLFAVDVTPDEAALGLGLSSLGPCDGPVWTLRIGKDTVTACWEWSDYRAQATEKAFGVGGEPGADVPELGEPTNQKAVKAVAVAAAACLMSRFVDRVEGTHVVDIDPTIELSGSAGGVTHEIARGGEATTTVTFAGKDMPVDMVAFLPDSVRRQIFGLVQE